MASDSTHTVDSSSGHHTSGHEGDAASEKSHAAVDLGKRLWKMIKTAATDFVDDLAMPLAAAVSFYSALSFGPLLVILIWIGGMLGAGAQASVVDQVRQVIGPQAGQAVDMVLQNASNRPQARTFAGIFGIGTLLFSASGIFAQLQQALNRIWEVEAKPEAGMLNWLRQRLLSLGMIPVIAFLLLVSLAVSAVLSGMLTGNGPIWQVVNIVVSLAVFTLLFAVVYKMLPDVKIAWKDVWVGAAMTAVLFALGKFLIGLYLGNSAVGSTYGAAGSLLVLLVWVYYSSIIVLFGAELTQSYVREFRHRHIEPDKHAVKIDSPKTSREGEASPA